MSKKTLGHILHEGGSDFFGNPSLNPLPYEKTEEEKQKEIILSKLEDVLENKEIWLISKGLDKRIENQLRIHWYWLKDKGYKEVAKFINAIIKGSE